MKRIMWQEITKERTRIKGTDLLTVILCKLVEESASLLGLEISQHGGDDGADVLYGIEVRRKAQASSNLCPISQNK